jgi:hypothetical protein
MKIEQKIVTGGISRTTTPKLKLLMNCEFPEPFKAARHIEHCASASGGKKRASTLATARQSKTLKPQVYFINALQDSESSPEAALCAYSAAPKI